MVNECLLRLMESWSPETEAYEMGRKNQSTPETRKLREVNTLAFGIQSHERYGFKVPKCSDKNKLSLKGLDETRTITSDSRQQVREDPL